MNRNSITRYSKMHFTELGFILGTIIGAILSIAITGYIIWTGMGIVAGSITGAIIDVYILKRKS